MSERNVPPERLLDSQASLRMANGLIEEFRLPEPRSFEEVPATVRARLELVTILSSVRQCRAEIDAALASDAASPRLTRASGLLDSIESQVRGIGMLLADSSPETPIP